MLADKSTVPDDDSILQEINNYLEGGEVISKNNGDSEETTSGPPRHMFMAVNYASVLDDHETKSSAARGTSDFFQVTMERRVVR